MKNDQAEESWDDAHVVDTIADIDENDRRVENDSAASEVSSPSTVGRQPPKPTFAVFALLMSVYSTILLVAMNFLPKVFNNDPGGIKQGIVFTIFISSWIYMQFYGNKIVRHHFGTQGGRNLEITPGQAILITLFMIFLGCLSAWIIN